MKKAITVFAVLAGMSSAAFARADAADLTATIPADAYDCTTVSVTVGGTDLDPSEFTASATASGGCSLKFKEKAPATYTTSVTDANGKVQTFKLVNGKLVNTAVVKPGTDGMRVTPG